jgi:hypothetical protein
MGLASDIVSVTITRATTTVDRAGFGVPLLVSYHSNFAGRTKQYAAATALADMVTDGFATTDPAYLMMTAVIAQNPRPTNVKVGRLANAPTQIVTCTPIPPAVAAVRIYTVTINGTAFNFTTDATPTAAEIVTGLTALINAGGEPVTASGTTTLILTADVAGTMFTLLLSDDSDGEYLWNREDDTADAGIAADMAAIALEDNDWYGVLYEGHGVAIQTLLATWTETAKKLFIATSADDDVYDGAETADIAYVLSNASREKSAVIFHDVPHSYPCCAWVGRMFPIDPGASTWAYQNLSGIAAVELSSAQITALEAKNCNYYMLLAGSNRTQEGKVAGDEWLDTMRFIDWFEANLQADYLELKFNKSDAGTKVPYTGAGIALNENVLWERIQAGIDAGGLADDGSHTVTVPDIQDVSSTDKNNRILNDVEFVAYLAGAIHKVAIAGVMTT